MKYDNLSAFVKHLQSAAPDHLDQLYLLLSKDAYERKSALCALLELLPNSTTHQGDAIDAVLDDLNTLSLFGEKQTVIVHHVDKLAKPATEKLIAYFENPTPHTTLILSGSALAKNTIFYKRCEKQGIVLDIPEQKPWEKEKHLQQWTVEAAAKSQKTLEFPAAVALIKQSGTDQELLEKEIEKLICYVGERTTITTEDVATLSNTVNSETAWQLGEALFHRRAETAFRISKALLQDGAPFLALIRQIRAQLQTGFQVCTILNTSGNRQEITTLFPYMKGNLLEKHIQNSNAYGLNRFKKGLLKVDEIEMAAKNGNTNHELLSDLLIGALTK